MKSLLKNAGLALLLGMPPIAAAQSAQDQSAQPAQQETAGWARAVPEFASYGSATEPNFAGAIGW